MIKTLTLILAATLIVIAGLGCKSYLTQTARPTSLPVSLGIATTNDTRAVADLKAAQALNAAANPTPTEPLVNAALMAAITLASALSGYLARHATLPATATGTTTSQTTKTQTVT